MSILDAIILGIVEGFTEFLPISSTAHLTFAEYFLKLEETDFIKSFTIIIQLGAILAVVFLFWKRLLRDFETNKKIIAAFVPTAVVGFVLYKIIKKYFIGNISLSLWVLGIGGIIIILFEKCYAKKILSSGTPEKNIKDLSYKEAVMVGLGQALAVVPGVSRSGATIISGLFCKLSRSEAVEFSFLLALPTMLAATGYDFLKNYNSFETGQMHLILVGLVASFVFGILGIRFLKYVASSTLKGFGWYRIIFAVLFLGFLSLI